MLPYTSKELLYMQQLLIVFTSVAVK